MPPSLAQLTRRSRTIPINLTPDIPDDSLDAIVVKLTYNPYLINPGFTARLQEAAERAEKDQGEDDKRTPEDRAHEVAEVQSRILKEVLIDWDMVDEDEKGKSTPYPLTAENVAKLGPFINNLIQSGIMADMNDPKAVKTK